MRKIRKTEVPQALRTAGGAIMARHENPISVPRLGKEINPYVLKASPTVLSLGSLIMDDDCDVHWVHGEEPYLITPNKKAIWLDVVN